MNLTQITKGRALVQDRLKSLSDDYNFARTDLQTELLELDRSEKMLLDGVDLSKIQLAEHVLWIKMYEPLQGDDVKEIIEAISDLADGAKIMRGSFFGTKNYDRFYHQGIGPTRYGYGPKHGSTVFSIGLQPVHRIERENESPRELTPDEVDAAIYLLKMLQVGRYLIAKKAE